MVDDIDFAITHVIRGEDHVTNTGAQIQMFRALTAQEIGPEMAKLLPLIGRDRAHARLKGQTA